VKLQKQSTAALSAKNIAEVKAWGNKPLQDTPYMGLLLLLADMLDTIAKGSSCYAVIGSTSSKTAFSFTLNAEGAKDARYAPDLATLATAAQDWL